MASRLGSLHLVGPAAALMLLAAGLALLAGAERNSATPQVPDAQAAPAAPPPLDADAQRIAALVAQLGHERYDKRVEATRALLACGESVTPLLRELGAQQTDPEIIHRLSYVLENISPPRAGVLVLRSVPESGLQCGDLITHVNGRRVSNMLALREQAQASRGPGRDAGSFMVRAVTADGPAERGPLEVGDLEAVCDFVAPRGQKIARAMRLYATGFAEEAHALLGQLETDVPEAELPALLRARIAHSAGHEQQALTLLEPHPEAIRADGQDFWRSPSLLDLAGPGKAPLRLELTLLSRAGPDVYEVDSDPDLRTQRVYVPARRYVDALAQAAQYWWLRYRPGWSPQVDRGGAAGNMLAVTAWMYHELGLESECCRLIGPRSRILDQTWVRVQTEAWLPFLQGRGSEAIDLFYEDAREILQRSSQDRNPFRTIRNPTVAASIAFFLYRQPRDKRVQELFDIVNQPGLDELPVYLEWMLTALDESNAPLIREHLQRALPRLTDRQAGRAAYHLALLEWTREQPEAQVLDACRVRLAQAPAFNEQAAWLQTLDGLALLAQGRAARAVELLQDSAGHSVLLSTARFHAQAPPAAAGIPALERPIAAVALDDAGRAWLVLTRSRALGWFDAEAGVFEPCAAPSAIWYPSPLTYPWVGAHPRSSRAWVFDRSRLHEVSQRPSGALLRMNLAPAQIAPLADVLGEHFDLLADSLSAAPHAPDENGSFLRAEVRANVEFVPDPDVPELGVLERLSDQPRIMHLALRGGPHLLLDVQTGRGWSSTWMAQRLNLLSRLTFLPQAQRASDAAASPILWLLSNEGLLRFDLDAEELTRVALPGDAPHPPLIPESVPYQRRDPRFVYAARLPEDGGQVYRVDVAAGQAAQVDLINEQLPLGYYSTLTRAQIRRLVDAALQRSGVPASEELIRDARALILVDRPEAPG